MVTKKTHTAIIFRIHSGIIDIPNAEQPLLANNTPLIYNIPTNQWVHDFVVSGPLPTSVPPTSVPPSSAPPTATSASSNVGGAIGGAVGGVIVIAAIGLFFYRRHKKASDNVPHPSLKMSGNDSNGDYEKEQSLFGQGNRNDNDYNGDRVQLQETSTERGPGQIPHLSSSAPLDSSSPFMQFMQQPSAPSPPQTVSTPPTPSMLHHSTMLTTPPSSSPPSATAVLQREVGAATGFPPLEQPQYSSYYGGDKEDFSMPPTYAHSHSAAVAYSNSPLYIPVNSDGYDVGGEVGLAEPRNPQQFGFGNETSPAASSSPSQIISGAPYAPQEPVLAGFNRWDSSNSGSYYPPPPGQQLLQPESSDLMQRQLKLMRAQHELDLERIRLEQEAQIHLMERQLKHGT